MSEPEYFDGEDDIINCVMDDFTLDDFLANKVTGSLLYENAIKSYEAKVENVVKGFYKNEVDYAHNSGSTIFDNEKDYDHLLDLFKIVFNNINLKYNLDIIYNDKDLMREFAYEELKNKPEDI